MASLETKEISQEDQKKLKVISAILNDKDFKQELFTEEIRANNFISYATSLYNLEDKENEIVHELFSKNEEYFETTWKGLTENTKKMAVLLEMAQLYVNFRYVADLSITDAKLISWINKVLEHAEENGTVLLARMAFQYLRKFFSMIELYVCLMVSPKERSLIDKESLYSRIEKIIQKLDLEGIVSKKEDLIVILRCKIKTFNYLDRHSNALRILKKLLNIYYENDLFQMVVIHLIGKCYNKANKNQDALKNFMKNVTNEHTYWFSEEENPLMEMKMRSLFEIGKIKFQLKNQEDAYAALTEFHETVSKFPKRHNLKHLFGEWWSLIGDIDSNLLEAKCILGKISPTELRFHKSDSNLNFSRALRTFQAARLTYENSNSKENRINEPLNHKQIIDEYENTDTIEMKMFFMKQANHQTDIGNHSEAIKIFDHLREDLDMKKYHKPNNSDVEKDKVQWGYKMFYEVYVPYSKSLISLNMYEEAIDLLDNAVVHMVECGEMKNRITLLTILKEHINLCIENRDFSKATSYMSRADEFIVGANLTQFTNANNATDPNVKKLSDLINIMNVYANLLMLKASCQMPRSCEKKKVQMKIFLQNWSVLLANPPNRTFANFCNKATCHFHLGEYDRSISVLENAKNLIQKGSPQGKKEKQIFSVFSCLLALKVKDCSNPLIRPLILPSSFQGILSAFRGLDVDPDGYEFMNLHSRFWKSCDLNEDVNLKTKWRLFKNSALIIGKTRRTSQVKLACSF